MNKRLILPVICIVALLSGCGIASETPPDTPSATPVEAPAETADTAALTYNGAVEVIPPVNNAIDEAAIEVFAQIGDTLPVSRGLVAKMLALAMNDKSSIDNFEREITFSDTKPELWYDRYINACVRTGLMMGGGGAFSPDSPLTVSQAQSLLDRLDPNNKIKMTIDANANKPISYALWTDLFYQLLKNVAGDNPVYGVFGIRHEELIVLATRGNNAKLGQWNMITDKGAYLYSGLAMDGYIDRQIEVLTKDGEILAILAVVSDEPTLENAYIVKAADMGVTVFAGGAERTYVYRAKPTAAVSGRVCDIKINNGAALEIKTYDETIRGKIKRATSDYLEIEGYGGIPLAQSAVFYSTTSADGVKLKTVFALTVGSDLADYILFNGEVRAAIVTKTADPSTIRVVISNSAYDGYIHNDVKLTATSDFTIHYGTESKSHLAGDIVTFSAESNMDMFDKKRVTIKPDTKDGKIQLLSVARKWSDNESPKYRGIIEIGLENPGFTIVNEVNMDEYLYAVVPSEMPTSHGIEAAKVQAVTARSFAYNQLYVNRFCRYGGNVDDSVSSQVYNNIPENPTSIKAVDETQGMCLTYNGAVISANFFSTSGGVTANAGEVWPNSVTKQFPNSTAEYLTSIIQYSGDTYGDLSNEETAAKFYKDTDVKGYDSGFSWFRWNVTMTVKQLSSSINSGVSRRYDANPNMIKTLQDNGVYRSRQISGIGDLVDIEVTKRSVAGNIMELKLTGTLATILVSTEYNVRYLLRPVSLDEGGKDIILIRKDGSTLTNYSVLPSAFMTFDKKLNSDGKLESVTFYGGGNGHGVGMSQNGVKGMIDSGKSFSEILLHYYSGTAIEKKY